MNRKCIKDNRIVLDWSQLLGFDQADKPSGNAQVRTLADPALVRLGAKVGQIKTTPVRKKSARS